ncbi:FAD/NAD(P)-binding protein [Kitasatospora sp. NPDC006697]|uniref:FAD/NAD(P)-binding protein n=1 Tax=Kitasatospora sp. NPDC006697 TaxID=3364020 RepID=UPI00369F57B3
MARPWRIAVVGSGPRGIMVTERLAARLEQQSAGRPVEIHLIDEVEVGCGRIFRTDQPDWFLMNTTPGIISLFSGTPDDGPARAGAGPSFAQWWSAEDPAGYPGPDGYAPRARYGRYLRFALDAVEYGLPPHARLFRVRATVSDLVPVERGYRLRLGGGEHLVVDRVVLATGHARPLPGGARPELAAFAARHAGLGYLSGDSPADMPLDTVPAGAVVGILGLGLSFYDVMAAFTLGRGGRFGEGADGELVYRPSGEEPVMVAGSRSGMPLLAKPVNRKPPGTARKPVVFTPDRIRPRTPGAPLDFATEVAPWLMAEVELVYRATALRRSHGDRAAEEFTAEVARSQESGPPDVVAIAARHGVEDLPALDLAALARPFAGRAFDRAEEFDRALAELLRESVREAERGNVDSPLMAAMDAVREARVAVRKVVDFGGLHPASHRDDFLGSFAPASSALVAGPPPVRVRQALALLAAGLLRVVGPDARIAADPGLGRFTIDSPAVPGSRTPVEVVVDARVPVPDLHGDPAPLTRSLRARGLWTEFVNRDARQSFPTGGVAVTRAPFHPVGRDGRPDTGLYVLGVPSENTRWFTQVGSGRPGSWGDFVGDADAIAEHALAGAHPHQERPGAPHSR